MPDPEPDAQSSPSPEGPHAGPAASEPTTRSERHARFDTPTEQSDHAEEYRTLGQGLGLNLGHSIPMPQTPFHAASTPIFMESGAIPPVIPPPSGTQATHANFLGTQSPGWGWGRGGQGPPPMQTQQGWSTEWGRGDTQGPSWSGAPGGGWGANHNPGIPVGRGSVGWPPQEDFLRSQSQSSRPISGPHATPSVMRLPDSLNPSSTTWGLPAVTDDVGRHCELTIYGYNFIITEQALNTQSQGRWLQRLQSFNLSYTDILHDLLVASFAPLTQPLKDPHDIRRQAEEFLSCFEHPTTVWDVDVTSLPRPQRQAIYGLTNSSRHAGVANRFLKFRFPFVRFQWHITTSYSTLALSMENWRQEPYPMNISFSWEALASRSMSSGLVARGTCTDSLVLSPRGYMTILKRRFVVTEVYQPELMIPIPYPSTSPPAPEEDALMIFTTSQTVIQFLRSSQQRMTFLIAVSALFASLKPIADRYSSVVGWVFAGIGIIAALVSLLSTFVGWGLSQIEARGAKYHQM